MLTFFPVQFNWTKNIVLFTCQRFLFVSFSSNLDIKWISKMFLVHKHWMYRKKLQCPRFFSHSSSWKKTGTNILFTPHYSGHDTNHHLSFMKTMQTWTNSKFFLDCKERFWLKCLQVWGNTREEIFANSLVIYFNSIKNHVHTKDWHQIKRF